MVVGEITTGTQVLVIGGGPGGYHAAAEAARRGKEVTLVESGDLGGVCLNVGCIPSKALIQGARSAAAPYRTGPSTVDFPALQTWKSDVVERLRRGVTQILKQADANVVRGHAVFSGADRVTVASEHGNQTFRFEHCIIATGSRPTVLRGFEPDGERILDSTGALALAEVPASLLVLGGGYIGLELGTAYAKLGSAVTVVEALDRILPTMDPDLAKVVHRRLIKLGVKVMLGARAAGWHEQGGQAVVTLVSGAADQPPAELRADKLLVAVGRRPNTEGLDLSVAGVSLGEGGFIAVDRTCRTSNPRVYAIGDVVGNPMLAHKATREAEVAAAAIAGEPAAMDAVTIAAVAFTDPEIASAGLTELEARAAGFTVTTGRAQFSAIGRALVAGDPEGFVKVVADAESGLLLGVQMAGPEVSELIAAAALALELGARVYDLAATVFPHPTLSEALREAAARIGHRP